MDSISTISTTDAARRLGLTPSRIRQLLQAGRLPGRKIGRDWLIEQADLESVELRPRGRTATKDQSPT